MGSTSGGASQDDASTERPESRIEEFLATGTSAAPPKVGEERLYVMRELAGPEAGELYFTRAEWDAFITGGEDGESGLSECGNPPDPG
jgi:hypothetical protein